MFYAFVRTLNRIGNPCDRIPTHVTVDTRMQLHCCVTVCAANCEANWVSLFLVRGVHETSRSLLLILLSETRTGMKVSSILVPIRSSKNCRADIVADRSSPFVFACSRCLTALKRRPSRTRCFEAGSAIYGGCVEALGLRHVGSPMLALPLAAAPGMSSCISIFVLFLSCKPLCGHPMSFKKASSTLEQSLQHSTALVVFCWCTVCVSLSCPVCLCCFLVVVY